MDPFEKEKEIIIQTAIDFISKRCVHGPAKKALVDCSDELYKLFEAVIDYKKCVISEFEEGMSDHLKGLQPQKDNKYYIQGFNISFATSLKIQEILNNNSSD